eukprot:scaffold54315_cov31-Tisochrysis_lutea.AAC.1
MAPAPTPDPDEPHLDWQPRPASARGGGAGHLQQVWQEQGLGGAQPSRIRLRGEEHGFIFAHFQRKCHAPTLLIAWRCKP